MGGEWLCHSSCLRGPLPPLEWTKLVLRVSLSLENSSLDYFIIFLPRIKLACRDFSSSECDRQPATLSSGSGFPDWPPGALKRSGCGIGDLSVFFLPSLKEIKGEEVQKGMGGGGQTNVFYLLVTYGI